MNDKPRVLILDDVGWWRDGAASLLEGQYEILEADSLLSAVMLLQSRVIDVAVIDIRLAEWDESNKEGLTFLDEFETYYPEDKGHAIILSGHGTITDAIQTLTKPSHNVTTYFEKEKFAAERKRFIEEVARAARATVGDRAQGERMVVRRDLPSSFLSSIDLDNLASALLPKQSNEFQTDRDLKLLLGNLLCGSAPFARSLRVVIEPMPSKNAIANVLCWSRKLVRALEVEIARIGVLDEHTSKASSQASTSRTKLASNSINDFEGTAYELPNLTFDEFLKISKS